MLSVARLQHGEAFGAGSVNQLIIERRAGERLRSGAVSHGERGRELDGGEAVEAAAKREIGNPSFVRLDRDERSR